MSHVLIKIHLKPADQIDNNLTPTGLIRVHNALDLLGDVYSRSEVPLNGLADIAHGISVDVVSDQDAPFNDMLEAHMISTDSLFEKAQELYKETLIKLTD